MPFIPTKLMTERAEYLIRTHLSQYLNRVRYVCSVPSKRPMLILKEKDGK